jgi:hypothetical protein
MLDFRARPIQTQPTPSNAGTEHLVLTAAHCVKDVPLASAVVLYDGAKPVRPMVVRQNVALFA